MSASLPSIGRYSAVLLMLIGVVHACMQTQMDFSSACRTQPVGALHNPTLAHSKSLLHQVTGSPMMC